MWGPLSHIFIYNASRGPKGQEEIFGAKASSDESKGKAKLIIPSPKKKKLIPLVKPKGIVVGTLTVLMPMVPKPEVDGLDLSDDDYNPLSAYMPKTTLLERMFPLSLKESIVTVSEE